ncbi:MAG TPA: M15 family metallopeptidase [Labilithrix sp.]
MSGASVQDALSGCSTSAVSGLDDQIIAEVNCAIGGELAQVKASNFAKGAATNPFMETPARNALEAALADKPGMTLDANSMLRTIAQQYLLYAWYQQGRCGIQLAAVPGSSNHETGLAVDVAEYDAWKPTLEAHGFKWFGSADVVHFDYVGAGSKDLRGEDVKAFQRLWNKNHPGDTIDVDGAYGPATESRIQQSPAAGFAIGSTCAVADAGAPKDGGDVAPATTSDPPPAPAPPPNQFLPPTPPKDASSSGCNAGGGAPTAPALLAAALALVVTRRRRAR